MKWFWRWIEKRRRRKAFLEWGQKRLVEMAEESRQLAEWRKANWPLSGRDGK